MAKENQQLTYIELVEELAELCSTKTTGTMFIVSDAGHSSRVSIKEGKIIFFAYRTNKGMDALFDLYEVKSGKYHFSKGVYNPYNILELPGTAELLQHFKDKTFPHTLMDTDADAPVPEQNSARINNSISQATEAAVKPATETNGMDTNKVSQLIDKLEASLVNFLGPFADIAIQDYLADNKRPETQAEFRTMIDFLILEIDDANDQKNFRNEAIKIVSQ